VAATHVSWESVRVWSAALGLLAVAACGSVFPAGGLSGHVVKARGQPVAAARVWVGDTATVSGPDGSFALQGPAPPGAPVRVRADGYGPLDWALPAAGTSRLKLALAAAEDFDPELFFLMTGGDEPWARSRWPDGQVPYAVRAPQPEPEQATRVLSESLDRWSMLTGGRVRFVRSDAGALAVRVRDSDPCGLKETVGCAVVVMSGGRILGAAVEVVVEHAWKPWVWLHLLGYAVGLDVSPDPDHVMHSPPRQVDWPSNAEAAVVGALYGNLPLVGPRPGQALRTAGLSPRRAAAGQTAVVRALPDR
jgi:hypothetical protein